MLYRAIHPDLSTIMTEGAADWEGGVDLLHGLGAGRAGPECNVGPTT